MLPYPASDPFEASASIRPSRYGMSDGEVVASELYINRAKHPMRLR